MVMSMKKNWWSMSVTSRVRCNGIERVEAISAVSLTDAQRDSLVKKLTDMTGKRIILTNKVRPEILGGVILRYSGIQLDGSVKARLDTFSESLKNLNL